MQYARCPALSPPCSVVGAATSATASLSPPPPSIAAWRAQACSSRSSSSWRQRCSPSFRSPAPQRARPSEFASRGVQTDRHLTCARLRIPADPPRAAVAARAQAALAAAPSAAATAQELTSEAAAAALARAALAAAPPPAAARLPGACSHSLATHQQALAARCCVAFAHRHYACAQANDGRRRRCRHGRQRRLCRLPRQLPRLSRDRRLRRCRHRRRRRKRFVQRRRWLRVRPSR